MAVNVLAYNPSAHIDPRISVGSSNMHLYLNVSEVIAGGRGRWGRCYVGNGYEKRAVGLMRTAYVAYSVCLIRRWGWGDPEAPVAYLGSGASGACHHRRQSPFRSAGKRETDMSERRSREMQILHTMVVIVVVNLAELVENAATRSS
jgi:hypothetical protein